MKILQIEQLFQQEETLVQVLEECKEEFDIIDNYSKSLKNNTIENGESLKKVLKELVGVYLALKPVLALAETEKKNREVRYYDSRRIEVEKEGGKFVSGATDKEASAYVAEYRRVRNLIQGYVDACNTAISTLQSVLGYLKEEMKLQQ